jgi:mono/diheme cytochrome c family protein
MARFGSIVLVAGLASIALSGPAQQPAPKVNNIPIQQTPIDSGEKMYSSYCAVCHGTSATGNGPAAQALKIPPADLTTLSQRNKGEFPARHVASVLQFGVQNPAHGTAVMPIWGDLMLTLHPARQDAAALVNQRIFNLTDYLKKIQK